MDYLVQEELYYKDFDIVKLANGTNKALKKVISNISVTNSIEIRFYYAGKGSTRVPVRGNFGPLISAISIESRKLYTMLTAHNHLIPLFFFY